MLSDESCQRCGETGRDRRTLWMACLYAMEELGLPFEQSVVSGQLLAEDGTKEAHERRLFYTLRVCKVCRADWMLAIRKWFETQPDRRYGGKTGVHVRELGAVREITLDEWRRRYGDREPHRIKK